MELNFGQALMWLKECPGARLKRKDWGGFWYMGYSVNEYGQVDLRNKIIMAKLKDGGYAPAQPYQADLLATDWELIEDKQRYDVYEMRLGEDDVIIAANVTEEEAEKLVNEDKHRRDMIPTIING